MSTRIDVTETELTLDGHRIATALAAPAGRVGHGPAALLVHGWTSAGARRSYSASSSAP